MIPKLFLQIAVLSLVGAPGALFADDDPVNPGAVYTMDNAASANNVLVFQRASDGSLTSESAVPTGGKGTGTGLGNQGGIILSRDGTWLFVCNAGSDEISVFAVTSGGLVLYDKVNSAGHRPISLTLHGDLLYVLNAGGAVGDKDNIVGFRFHSGQLTPITGSTHALSADNTGPAQVSFTSGGDVLVATEKNTRIIDTFTVGADGLVNGQKVFTSPVPTPFGFAVGRKSRIFVSEANAGVANGSAVASFQVSDEGDLVSISGSVPTKQSAACWVALTRNERFAYASDTGSGIITGYAVSPDGNLELLNANGVTGVTGAGSKPIDLAFSRNSQYFYSLNSGSGSISAFRVNSDGSLSPVQGASGIPASADGLAAQ